MSYGIIDTLKKAHPVSQLCEVLDVHKSSYYYWQAHREPPAARIHLQMQVKAIHAEVNQTYGSRRMSDALKEKGLEVGRYQARCLMQEAGSVAIYPKKRHRYPAGEVSRVADNHLNREFDASAPNQKWVGDITYLWTASGWMYLAVVLDLFSRKVVGWQLSAAPDTALILAALNQAVILRQVTASTGLLFHSDQGCQYTSHAYQDRLTELGIKASMSRRANCWDNAVMERFFRSLKVEAISRERYQTADELTWAVKKYIHFYNTKRLHSVIGAKTPNQFEQLFLKQA
ncbi:IS3 family transposase [Candidatus Thiothrix anitrata]|uniref:IS3 family transposase n=1 Tax=Candidatus Thiothrix anitrata TaxID=2823902 RepID=A0ABX7X9D4_9GAMM|nr:IS3 family transposase [Candidatus Thiothrix anitrata]QTR51860.1 IS3 family transposase [Candidatus Thiothrix anitrata]